MAQKHGRSPEEEKKQAVEAAWLNYFNKILYEQSIITEQQRNQIANKIATRKPSAAKQKSREMEL